MAYGSSFYNVEAEINLHDHSDYAEAYAAALAQGSPFSGVGSWVDSTINKLGDWVDQNISSLPLGIFSAAGTILPGVAIAGTKYYVPTGINQSILALFSGSQWAKNVISYSFPDSRGDYGAINPSASGYKPLSFETEQAVRYALEGYSPYAGGSKMSLTSVESFTNLSIYEAGRDGADLQVSGYTPGNIIDRSHAYYPGVPVYGGDVWLTYGNSSAPVGSYARMIVLHELGHALGLKHPHDSGGALPKMSSFLDNSENTVMTYNNYVDNPQTYMRYDIAALQEMYGANFSTNSGDTVYKWDPVTGETLVNGVGQGAPGTNKIFLTIWDGGGNDTYDLSNYSENSVIDLTPGGWSRFSGKQLALKSYDGVYASGNVYNALQYKGDTRSLIENVIAGAGSDKITGNAANNKLVGNEGNDYLYGAAGIDELIGGVGHDSLSGGDDQDWLYGESGSDLLSGDAGNDYLYGGNDLDRLYGGAGDDMLVGGEGADTLDGGDGVDTVSYDGATSGLVINLDNTAASTGEAQGDVYSSIELVLASQHADVVYGTGMRDVVYANYGNDIIHSYGGNDFIDGQAGNDTLDAGWGNDEMVGGAGRDTFVFSSVLDATSNVDRIWDFSAAEDVIRLDRGIFRGFEAGVSLAIGVRATAAKAQIVYNSSTGALSYDADGTGAAAQVKFAVLAANLALTANNFVL